MLFSLSDNPTPTPARGIKYTYDYCSPQARGIKCIYFIFSMHFYILGVFSFIDKGLHVFFYLIVLHTGMKDIK